ncbi:MAG: NAD-dependent epimerase/dehydratase family protein [Phycisphaeraceae bacterium]|nr:NAD-dependent epimerase/dehydratase family protein [Phycisphaeraceae bacterium]
MTITRRHFVHTLLATGAATAIATPRALAWQRRAVKPKSILILGGTGFLGPATIEAALARGHKVTIFNRGRTERYRPLKQDAVEHLYGNRDPEKHAQEDDTTTPKGLSQLEGKKFDVVIDNSGYYPRIVKASAEWAAKNAGMYIFISSISAYASSATPEGDESAPVGTMEDPTIENMGPSFEYYGPLKALCEQASEAAMPGKAAIVRPGYIVGPGDPTDRFTYWPVRANMGGEMLAPGNPDDPIQVIDVRDLAEFLITLAENSTAGVFNAVGPASPARWGDVLSACAAAAASRPTLTWIDSQFLQSNGLPGGSLPIWIPPQGDYAGFHRWSNDRAEAAGLRFRPVETIVRDTLAWWPSEVDRRRRAGELLTEEAKAAGREPPRLGDPTLLKAGIPPEREQAILAAWHDSRK